MHHRVMRWVGLVCLVGAPLSGLARTPSTGNSNDPMPSADGTKLQEIVVTAERRTTTEQKTAESISVRKGAEMAGQGRYSLAQILQDVPGVSGGEALTTGSAIGSGSDLPSVGLAIRGIQSNAAAGGSTTSVAPASALYVDGVYEGIGGNYDIDRVEVMRGPQGTLYGRSATSGLVAIHTFDPNLQRFGGDASLEFGNYALKHYTAAVNVPLVDDVLAVRVSGNRYQRNGYDTSNEDGGLASTDGRIKVLYRPTHDLSVLLGAALENNTTREPDVSILLSAPNTFQYLPAPVGMGSNDSRQYWARIQWNLGPATLTYEPAFRSWNSSATNYARTPLLNINQNIATPKDNFITQELHITSNPGSKLSWQAGTMYYHNDLSNSNEIVFYPSGALAFNSVTHEKTTRGIGAFAQATYAFVPTWRLTGGLRYDYTKVMVNQAYTSITLLTQSLGGSAGTRVFNNVTYKARLEHDLTAQNMLYASVSTGFSPGDITVTTGQTGNPIPLALKAETLTAYEVGSKNRFLDESLQVNGAIFYYDYAGYQTASINVDPQNPANPEFTTLASPARAYGGELELLYMVTPHDRVGFNTSYTNAYYVDKNQSLIPTGTGSYVTFADFYALKGIPGVVPLTSDLSYEHVLPLPGGSTLMLHGDVRFLSAYDSTGVTEAQLQGGAYPYIRVGGQVVGDLTLTWLSSSDTYEVSGYVQNLGDNRYKTDIGVNGNSYTAFPYQPRTYGVVLTAHF
jgi:outer membrane receptor protein involved in Fe transport